MNLLRQLAEKPWLNVSEEKDFQSPGNGAVVRRPASMGLNFLIAAMSVLFFMLVVAYAGRMAYEDWRPAPPPDLLWQNTIMLILASAAMEWARYSAGRDQRGGVKLGMFGGGVFAAAFLTGQAVAWRELNAMEYFDATNPSIAFFYLITGLHALHLLGGLAAWGWSFEKLLRSADFAKVSRSVNLCTRYWHFLLIVWLVLFGLLFSGNDSLDILLTICGFK